MQEYETLYERIYAFRNLYNAYKEARKGKRWKDAAIKFEINLMEALLLLKYQLQNKTYTLAPYNCFYVYEPKERLVMSNSYKDKVVQHSLCDNVLEPILTKSFIFDNYASQVGKGTDLGLNRLTEFLRKYYRQHKSADGWVLKCDIRKYFYNINHGVLKSLLRKHISCENTLWLLDMIIDSTEGEVGIPIGNQSSQLFALLYLNGLDHYIKEKLGIKFYGRYMDDFYLIHEDKEFLKKCLNEIRAYVGKLGLELNEKTQISPLRNGIDFFRLSHIFDGQRKGHTETTAAIENGYLSPPKKVQRLARTGQVADESYRMFVSQLARTRGARKLLSSDKKDR